MSFKINKICLVGVDDGQLISDKTTSAQVAQARVNVVMALIFSDMTVIMLIYPNVVEQAESETNQVKAKPIS